MNKFSIFLLFLFFTCLQACKDDPKPDVLEMNLAEMNFQIAAESKGLIIKSNTKWTVESTPAWLTCEPASGEYSSNLTVKVVANAVSAVREHTLAIKSADGQIIRELRVSQAGFPVNITVPASALANMEGGDVKVAVTAPADYSWTVQIPNGAFVSEKSKTDNEIVFTTIPNNTGESRQVVITFKLTDTDKEAKLTMIQPTKEVITIRPAAIGTDTSERPTSDTYSTDANERHWKNYIPDGNRFIMQNHPAGSSNRRLHVILLKNVTDQPTGPIEFKVEGCTEARWDQNDYFEGNNNTRYTVNADGTANPPIYLKTVGLAAGEEAFLLFRIRNNTGIADNPQTTAGEYISKFTITGEGINIKGTLEVVTVAP